MGGGPAWPLSLTHEERTGDSLRFVCISDTHMQHNHLNLPDGDVLIHCGDFTNHGSLPEIEEFLEWLSTLKYKHIIVIPGNHEMLLDAPYYEDYWSDWATQKECSIEAFKAFSNLSNVTLLIDDDIVVEGFRIWGSPWVPQHGGWKTGFNKTTDELELHWENVIPDNIDILVTHTPCKGYGDREPLGHTVGCPHLLSAIEKIKPKFHVCGHIHSDYGVHKFESFDGVSINASSVTDYYYTSLRNPIIFDVAL